MPDAVLRPLVAKTLIGLEQLLAQELAALGAEQISVGKTVVHFRGDRRRLYLANLACRTAIRILQPVEQFRAEDEKACYQGVQRVDWASYLAPTGSLAIDAIVRQAFTTNSLYVAQLAKDAIVDQFRDRFAARPSVDLADPDLRINVHVSKGQVTVALDSSGESLHKRGYRTETGEAPLNEVLAAGIVQLTGWDRSAPLVDFMCGSGTLPIEAALWAANIAPGLLRRDYGFMRWPDFDAELLHTLRNELASARRPSRAILVGSDVDDSALSAARDNARRAGVLVSIRWQNVSFDELEPPAEAGIVVSNPPYDERLKLAHRAAFYRRLGDTLKCRWRGYTAYLLTSHPEASRELGLRSSSKTRLFNGPIECRLLKLEIAPAADSATGQGEPSAERRVNKKAVDASLVDFTNRLRRMARHWLKWARRQQLDAVRLYDRDVPEVPVTIDWYASWVHVEEQERPHSRSAIEQQRWLESLLESVAAALDVGAERIYVKALGQRVRLWKATAGSSSLATIQEGARSYRLPPAELTWQLPLDLRTIRSLVEKRACGQRVLLLGDSVASVTVAAAVGQAREITTVAAERLLVGVRASLESSGAWQGRRRFLSVSLWDAVGQLTAGQFDLAVAAPPLFFDKDAPADYRAAPQQHAHFAGKILELLGPGGRLYYLSSARRFKLLESAIAGATVREVSRQTIPPDFRDRRVHRCWLVQRAALAAS
jgi:23S rRNA (guanine2445-N2)-methyltransferase / 23S rRNA (guanine2069-N7)-methyltransferase